MKVLILSDIHDNIVNLDKALAIGKAESAEVVVCCGDITNQETLGRFIALDWPVHIVHGNADLYDPVEIPIGGKVRYHGEIAVLKIDGRLIGICHEPYKLDGVMALAGSEQCEIIFYGHTHKPWEQAIRGVRTINPGNLNGVQFAASFAIWDTVSNEVELKVL